MDADEIKDWSASVGDCVLEILTGEAETMIKKSSMHRISKAVQRCAELELRKVTSADLIPSYFYGDDEEDF